MTEHTQRCAPRVYTPNQARQRQRRCLAQPVVSRTLWQLLERAKQGGCRPGPGPESPTEQLSDKRGIKTFKSEPVFMNEEKILFSLISQLTADCYCLSYLLVVLGSSRFSFMVWKCFLRSPLNLKKSSGIRLGVTVSQDKTIVKLKSNIHCVNLKMCISALLLIRTVWLWSQNHCLKKYLSVNHLYQVCILHSVPLLTKYKNAIHLQPSVEIT